ncbi:hypothetical protein [Parasitella parasitica]|uniref:Mid2 domain-containing protein n=1 Tax=Parasitella parasitica TaxID=35722 RepID=A0A0B7NJD2_9FUNG|nr:hypothetical protein [Parasitella parasitica]
MQSKSIRLIVLFVALLLVQDIRAQFLCNVFDTCTSSTAEPGASTTNVPSTSSNASTPSTSSSAPPIRSSSSTLPSLTSSIQPSSSVALPSSSSSSSPTPSSVTPSKTSKTSSTSSESKSSTLPSESSSTTSSDEEKPASSGGNNVGVIVGSVCGFVAIIGAGFAYAFFSKTRRNNRRNKRLDSENSDLYNNSYHPDSYNNTRPSPALAASAVAAADGIHSNNNRGQWDMAEQQYNYNNTTMPMAAATTQDSYYTSPQMGYTVDSGNYYGQDYYNSGYQQPHYDAYAIQQQSPVMNASMAPLPNLPQQNLSSAPIATTNSNVYQTPHSYPEESTTANK